MLWKKMLRDIRANFAQFFSIFLLSAVAMWCYTGFQANVIGGKKARVEFEESTNFADGWIYGAGFDDESADKLRSVDKVKDVQLRTEVLGKADEKYNTAEIWCYFQNETAVTVPANVGGADFGPDDTDGVWLFDRFADTWGLEIGDSFTVHVMGQDIEKEIKGFVNIPEREFLCASTDTDTDFHNIGYVYLPLNVLPEEMRISNELIFTCEGDPLKLEDDIEKALDGGYAFIADRKSIDGYSRLTDELAQHDSFSYVFSFVFLAIAILVIVTTMKRMVTQQRTQIGTLNALGMKNRKIMAHYISFSVVISALGCITGIVLGIFTFGKMMVDMFSEFYPVPGWKAGYDCKSPLLALGIVLVCGAAAYLSCRQILKIHPSEALRPAAAKSAKATIFEKLPFWNKLGFTARYDLRDIARSKMRAVMGVFGTCMGMMLMNLGLGAYDTLDCVRSWYFTDLQNYQYQVLFNDSCTAEDAEELRNETDGELISMAMISIAADSHPVSDDILSAKLAVTEGKDLYRLSDRELELTSLKAGTVALTMKQADRLGLSEGDKVYWKTQEDNSWNESVIGLVSRHPSITGITILREDYEKLGYDFRPAMLVSQKDCENLEGREGVSAVHNMEDLKAAFDKNMEIMDLLVWFMVFFSALLIVIVLYNSGNLSFNEREKEFATLNVLGFKSSAIRRLISTQNLWLSIIGVLLGLPLGQIPLQAMMDSNGDGVDWPCYIAPTTYLLAGIFVMAVSILVGFMFSKRIKRIDMAEVLKGME
ncbi:MAG: ABC transporter permease [Ruminococcus sp.]|uniref:ABC transporter permease n=1 Tax=Ruminococcus sp. TaxID=41978 RepID=UPI0025CE8FA8|nr:ABC transporter permease [Ruminococcus sp.]MBR0530370.1 ABC transporter permease [Ruminococcus sp.]